MTDSEVAQKVSDFMVSKKGELEDLRYTIATSEYLKQLRELLPFAEGKILASEFKNSIEAILGPETEADK